MISLIASIGKNNEIGINGDLVWHIPADMKFFKSTTINHIVVMGFNTYKSLPGPLKDREMIVLSKNRTSNDVKIIRDYKEIIDKYENSENEIFIIGGATLYKLYLEYAKRMYLTEIDSECKSADTFFPEFDKNEWNDEVLDESEHNKIKYKIHKYEKKNYDK